MPNIFNSVQQTKPKKNRFDLSHDVKLTCKMGELIPTLAMECVPGDSFNIGCESLLRFQPLIAPIMHRVDVTMHYFFVPNRLVWPNWEKYITDYNDGNPIPAFPTLTLGAQFSRLCNYLGLPNSIVGAGFGDETVSALPFAAYQRIYNEYYRDQNLQLDVEDLTTLVDGDNVANILQLIALRNRCWEHDYFTAALPFAQKGSAVSIPLGEITLKDTWDDPDTENPSFKTSAGASPTATNIYQDLIAGDTSVTTPAAVDPLAYDPEGSLEVLPTTINDLRRAFKLQEWLEKAARGGSRYIENIRAFFGVQSSDRRLQRPEFITGTKSPVIISEVLNTTGTVDAPQGNMAGHGVSVTQGKYGNYRCEEHGYIIGIMSIMPKTAYQDGIPKHFLKINNAFELYWPQFAHLGEQGIENREVFAWQTSIPGGATWGYIPRYAEYKYMPNRVAGEMGNSLDFWHMGRKFDSLPQLNASFVQSDPTTRIFAVTDADDQCIVQILHKISAIRPMPKFGTPSF